MKIQGVELNTFMEQAWPSDDWYWEHDLFDEYPELEVVYDTNELGDLFWQGVDNRDSLSLESLIRQWQKSKLSTDFVVTVPNEHVEQFKQYIAIIKGVIR